MISSRSALCLFLLAAPLAPAHAVLVWSANFNSYDTSGGAVNVTVNSTGNDDTLSGFTYAPTTAGTSSTQQVANSALLTGNALQLVYTNATGGNVNNVGMTIFQGAQDSLGGSGLYVMSTDMVRTSSSSISAARSWAATDDATTTGSTNTTNTTATNIAQNTVLRFTLVINQTGSAITLPGSLGSLADDAEASYFFDGTNYVGLTITSGITSTGITGFATSPFRSNNLASGQSITVWYDNMGLWNASSDTVNGTSILSLAPGTVVPEPSVIGLSLAACALVLVLRRREAGAGSPLV